MGRAGNGAKQEACRRSTMRPEKVSGQRSERSLGDRALLVPIRVELDPALLHQDGRVVVTWIERDAAEVTFHDPAPFENQRRI